MSNTVNVSAENSPESVKALLLQVAHSSEHLYHEKPNEPNVMLRSFTDKVLEFELQYVLKDVNKKSEVLNDINLSIAKLFKERNIEIL